MRILCVGASHKTADLDLREKLYFDEGLSRRALAELARAWPQAEAVVLSTCNRSELYVALPSGQPPGEDRLRRWLAEFHGLPAQKVESCLYLLKDAAAVEHLFSVAAGLDSLVPGEPQILGQLRAAYARSVELGTAGPMMNHLFPSAFHAAKSVRSETDLDHGCASVASVAIDCVYRHFPSLAGKCVLNVGAGKMSELMLRHMVRLGASRILLANRSAPKARALARAHGGRAVPFGRLRQHLAAADVVLTSTASTSPIFTAKMIQEAQRKRNGRPLLLLDIAVPRDVEPAAARVRNVFLHDIDSLQQVVERTLRARRGPIARARKLLAEHVRRFQQGLSVRSVAPTIQALYRRMRQVLDEELLAARNKLSSHKDADADARILQHALHRALRQIVHPCVTHLRRQADGDAARATAELLRKLFDLDADKPS